MSLNIKTATGLLEIGGNVTKEKVISALEYVPADTEVVNDHADDVNAHVSAADRASWNNKDYNALENTPNITDDGSNNLTISDNNGNAIAKFDADGLTTTNVNAKTIKLDGEDLGVRLDEIEAISLPNILDNESGDLTISDESGNAIMKVDEGGLTTTFVTAQGVDIDGIDVGSTISTHTGNTDIHITSAERQAWNAKVTTQYVDQKVAELVDSSPEALNTLNELAAALGDDPNFATTVTNEIAKKADKTYVDQELNKKSDSGHTHEQYLVASDIANKADKSELHEHTNKSELDKITTGKVSVWDGKADKSYVDAELAKKAESSHTHSQYLTASDISGKADTSYVDEELAKKSDSTHIHSQYLEADDIANFATTEYVNSELAKKANSTHAHTIANITGLQSALDGKASTEHGTHVSYSTTAPVMDGTASVGTASTVARSDHRHPTDTSRASQTDLDALTNVVNGKANATHSHTITDVTNLQTTLDSKANKATTLEGYGITDAASKTYVDTLIEGLTTEGTADAALVQAALTAHTGDTNNPHGVTLVQLGVNATGVELSYVAGATSNIQSQLDNKASVTHTHEQYLGSSDIEGKADKSYVDTELAKKSDATHTHDQYLDASDIEGLATEDFVTSKIAEAKLESSDVDLSAYATTSYVDEKLEAKANTNHTHAISEVTNLQNTLNSKADKSEIHAHNNKAELDKITTGKVAYWDAKSEFSGEYSDLNNAPNITEDNSGEVVYADEHENIVLRVNSDGLQTTQIMTNTIVVNGTEISSIDSLELITVADIDAICGATT